LRETLLSSIKINFIAESLIVFGRMLAGNIRNWRRAVKSAANCRKGWDIQLWNNWNGKQDRCQIDPEGLSWKNQNFVRWDNFAFPFMGFSAKLFFLSRANKQITGKYFENEGKFFSIANICFLYM